MTPLPTYEIRSVIVVQRFGLWHAQAMMNDDSAGTTIKDEADIIAILNQQIERLSEAVEYKQGMIDRLMGQNEILMKQIDHLHRK